MNGELFQRQVIVQIGTSGSEGREFTDLDVEFSVQKTRASTPNEATITLWNMAPESVALMQHPDSVVRLFAGYDVARLIFEGSPVRNGTRMSRTGPDRKLEIEAQDGGRELGSAVLSASLTGRVTFQQVFALVSEQLGLPAGTQRLPSGADAIAWPDGVTLHGTAREILSRAAEASNCEWWVNDGQLMFLESGGDIGGTAIEFSAAAGNLIGSVEQTDDSGIEFTGLLDAGVQPGSLVSVVSEAVSGVFVAHDITFSGSSRGGEFYVRVSAYPRGSKPATSSPSTATPSSTSAQVPASGADTPADADVLEELSRAIKAGLRVCLPAAVLAYDAAKQTCSAQPSIRAKFSRADGTTVDVPYPPVHNVPVAWTQAGSASIVLPLGAGDDVLLIFGDRSVDEWRAQSSGVVSARDPRLHNISDAFAIPGVSRPADPLPAAAFATGATVLRSGDLRLGDSTATERAVLGSALESDLSTLVQALYAFLLTSSTATTAPQIAAAAVTALVSITVPFVARFTASVSAGAPHLSTVVKVK